MQTYCASCKKTGNNNAKAINTKHGRLMLKSICTVCGKKKSRFIFSDQKGHGLLSSLGIKTPLSKTPGFNILL